MDGKEIIQMEALVDENIELKKQLATICHVDVNNGEEFDWDILHRVWDLEDSLERIISMGNTYRNNPQDGIYAIVKSAEKALERSRSLK